MLNLLKIYNPIWDYLDLHLIRNSHKLKLNENKYCIGLFPGLLIIDV